MRRLVLRLAACVLLVGAGGAQARPFTLDDLLAQQRLGPVMLDPSERWLIVSSTAPYASGERYDLGYFADMTLGRLDVVAADGSGTIHRLFGDDSGYGYQAGPFSPSGDRMAVVRARGHSTELGVVTLATGAAVWTGLTPVFNLVGRAMQWRGEDELIVLTREPAAAAWVPGAAWQAQARIAEKWAATAKGGVGVSVMGSGRYLGEHDRSEPGSLAAVDARTGKTRVLARGDFLDLELSPDGAFAAAVAAGEDIQPDPTVLAGASEPYRRYRLSVTDLSTAETWSPRPNWEMALGLLAWAPRGHDLLVYGKADTEAWDAARYWRLDADRRSAAPLDLKGLKPGPDTDDSGLRLARGAWLGEDPVVLARATAGTGRRDWYRLSGRGSVNLTHALSDGAGTLQAVDAAGLVVSQGGYVWRINPQGRALAVSFAADVVAGPGAPEGGRLPAAGRPRLAALATLHLGRAGLAAATARRTIAGFEPRSKTATGDEQVLVAGERRSVVATVRKSATGVETVVLHAPGAALEVLTLNAPMAQVEVIAPRPVRHRGLHGEPLTSWLYAPQTAPGQTVPLIVIPYPGETFGDDPAGLPPPLSRRYPCLQLLVAAGFAVLLPSLPIDRSAEPTLGLADQILAAVDAIDTPAVDTTRVALWGHSYGAYAALAAATQSPRFKAIVAAAASPNLFTAYERSPLYTQAIPDAGYPFANSAGWLETGQARMGTAPWDEPQRYLRNSPLFQVKAITAPVLLITGDLDGDPLGARAMFNALYRLGKDAVLLDYFGEGHVAFSPGNIRDQHQRTLTFLAQSLAGPGPPAGRAQPPPQSEPPSAEPRPPETPPA